MGQKGDRASKEPLARQLYVGGSNLAEIARQLDVSVNTLSTWKGDTKPTNGEGPDEWDRARMQKRGNIQRLRDLFEGMLEYIESLPKSEIVAKPGLADSLAKYGAIIERWDRVEKTRALANDVAKEVKKAGLSDDAAEDIRRRILMGE